MDFLRLRLHRASGATGLGAADWARGFLVKAANTLAHLAAEGKDGGYLGDRCDGDTLQALALTPAQMAEILAATRLARMEN